MRTPAPLESGTGALEQPGSCDQRTAGGRQNDQASRAAHAYAAHGWPVFPLRGKLPARPKSAGGRGFYDATTDPDVIDRMWRAYPGANIGIRTGEQSGLAVLDVDPRHGGTDSLARIELERGCLPGTLMQITGSDGLHMLFRWQPGLGCGANVWGPGLDLRGEGGYIVAAPSVHPDTGRPYAWHGDEWVHDLPLWPNRQLPPERPRAVQPVAVRAREHQAGQGPLSGLVDVVLGAAQGERNSKLNWASYRAGGHIVSGRLELNATRDALLAAALQIGLPEPEALGTLASGLRAAGAA